jgi:hypothetical protein
LKRGEVLQLAPADEDDCGFFCNNDHGEYIYASKQKSKGTLIMRSTFLWREDNSSQSNVHFARPETLLHATKCPRGQRGCKQQGATQVAWERQFLGKDIHAGAARKWRGRKSDGRGAQG